MIEIRPIRLQEIPAAKRDILSVARRVHGWPVTLEQVIRRTDFF